MKKINNYLRKLHVIWFILLLTLLAKMLTACFVVILYAFDIDVPEDTYDWDHGIIYMFFLAVIFAPIIETLLFQLLPYKFLSKIRYFKKNWVWIIVISSLIFGYGHSSSIYHMMATFMIGSFFTYGYILRIGKSPYWTVVITHALVNLPSVILYYYFPELLK